MTSQRLNKWVCGFQAALWLILRILKKTKNIATNCQTVWNEGHGDMTQAFPLPLQILNNRVWVVFKCPLHTADVGDPHVLTLPMSKSTFALHHVEAVSTWQVTAFRMNERSRLPVADMIHTGSSPPPVQSYSLIRPNVKKVKNTWLAMYVPTQTILTENDWLHEGDYIGIQGLSFTNLIIRGDAAPDWTHTHTRN